MKAQKNKLKFEKFSVAKLNNLSTIFGGNETGDDGGETNTGNQQTGSGVRCLLTINNN
jgi:hypothetical protein